MARPFASYNGDQSYLLVSYSHRDSAEIYKELVWLKGSGLNIWYDEGIAPGASWREELATAIANCHFFLFFATPNSVSSKIASER
jgi:hypothetical protein